MTGAEAPGADAGTEPVISVVVVSWNSGAPLLQTLRSLAAHPPSVPWEAIVVDNASTDGSLDQVRAELGWVRVIANSRNRGLAAANNQGLLASTAPFVLISNPDVTYRPGTVDALLDLLRRRPRAAFAVARLEHADGRHQTAAGDLPTFGEAVLGRWAGKSLQGGRADRHGFWWHGWAHDEEVQIGHGAEACYLVRRHAVGEIGSQDERFVLDWEGIDWSARAGEAGWEIWFCPAAVAVHLGGVSVKQVPFRWIARSHRGMYQYFRRRVPAPARPVLAAAIGARALTKAAVMAAGVRMYEKTHEQHPA